jgi:ATP-dependent Clp endopeptidase proteolytic subunit ClpP
MATENAPSTGEIWVLEFTADSAQAFRDSVVSKSKQDPNKPIVIYIDSYGGNVDALAKMIGTIEEIPNPVVTVCQGKAMSAGAVLLSHGDIRFCDTNSRVMIHEVSSGTHGHVDDMHIDTQEAKRLNQWLLDLLAKNCGYSSYANIKQLIKDSDGRDRYMSAKDSLDFGVVDFIGVPSIVANTQYEIDIVAPKKRIRASILENKALKVKPKKKKKK